MHVDIHEQVLDRAKGIHVIENNHKRFFQRRHARGKRGQRRGDECKQDEDSDCDKDKLILDLQQQLLCSRRQCETLKSDLQNNEDLKDLIVMIARSSRQKINHLEQELQRLQMKLYKCQSPESTTKKFYSTFVEKE